jgi:glutamate-ammonia-ligase adenylyltransferase
MALARARVVFGSSEARAGVSAIIAKVLAGDRPVRDVADEARSMRTEMAKHKPAKGPLDAKLLPGGLVDLEFAVHVLQLTHRTAFDPHLGRAIDALAAAGLVPPETRASYDLLARLLVTMRLVAPDAEPPAEATRALVAAALRLPDWEAVVASLDHARQEVGLLWNGVA